MYIVGLTGGIGSGKSAVSDLFAQIGITVVDADIAARIVVEPGTKALDLIAKHFGSSVLQQDGSLSRALLRTKIFNNPTEKQWLENLLHPLIGNEIDRQIHAAKSPYVIFVSPLLIESGQYQRCDRILVIDVSEDIQLRRTMQRDQNEEQQVKRIIASQVSRKERLALADDIIDNSGDVADLRNIVQTLHQQYLQFAKNTLDRDTKSNEPKPER